jgi:hypothetical protein
LLPFIDALQAEDWTEAERLQQQVAQLEREADKLKKDVRVHLPKSLFLPVPRSDLLELVSIQDKVANTARDVAVLVVDRNMCFPDNLQADLQDFVAACTDTVNQALSAIQELDELLEVGFTGLEVKRVEAMLKELDKMERKTDKMAVALRGKLFKLESELPPVDVMFYYRVLYLLGTLADEAETVGDRLQILMAK